MKIKNTTDFPKHFLRRMTSWCCRQLKMPVKSIKQIGFLNREYGTSGHCYSSSGYIVVSIERRFEYKMRDINEREKLLLEKRYEPGYADGRVYVGTAGSGRFILRELGPVACVEQQAAQECGRVNDLVRVTAHECAHRMQNLEGSGTRHSRRYGYRTRGGSEKRTRHHERAVLAAFRADRDNLIEAWMQEPKQRTPKPKQTTLDKNTLKLKQWERKLSLAKTKVRVYRTRVRSSQRAATKGTGNALRKGKVD